jgi:hypothetical protein
MKVYLSIMNYAVSICRVVIRHSNPQVGSEITVDFDDLDGIEFEETRLPTEWDYVADVLKPWGGAYSFEIHKIKRIDALGCYAETELQMDTPEYDDDLDSRVPPEESEFFEPAVE